MYKRATADSIFFFMRSRATGQGLTGLTPTAVVAKDQGAQAAAAGTITELGGGQYRFDGTAEDFNGDAIGFVFSADSALDYDLTVRTSPVSFSQLTTPTNVSRISNVIQRP